MAIVFKEEGHLYESIDQDKIDWTSVTSFIGMFKPKFDREGQAKKSSKNKKSKWYGMTPKEILDAWDNETNRAIKLGNFYHNQREADMLDFKTIERRLSTPGITELTITTLKEFHTIIDYYNSLQEKKGRLFYEIDDCNWDDTTGLKKILLMLI